MIDIEIKLNEALNWIEKHEKKSTKHDEILRLLTIGVTYCMFSSTLFLGIIIILGGVTKVLAILGMVPIILSSFYMFLLMRKIRKAND